MKETSKMRARRLVRGDFVNYLHGDVIDIGAGDDPLCVIDGTVKYWDVNQGDAQLMSGVPDEVYGAVYSSHCLEHLRDIPESLRNWTRILKPGGFLYIVVPDYCLYEKLTWPSMYNGDHKHSFSLTFPRSAVGRDNHWNIAGDLFPVLSGIGVHPVRIEEESFGFDFNQGIYDQTRGDAVAQICIIGRKQ